MYNLVRRGAVLDEINETNRETFEKSSKNSSSVFSNKYFKKESGQLLKNSSDSSSSNKSKIIIINGPSNSINPEHIKNIVS